MDYRKKILATLNKQSSEFRADNRINKFDTVEFNRDLITKGIEIKSGTKGKVIWEGPSKFPKDITIVDAQGNSTVEKGKLFLVVLDGDQKIYVNEADLSKIAPVAKPVYKPAYKPKYRGPQRGDEPQERTWEQQHCQHDWDQYEDRRGRMISECKKCHLKIEER